MHLLQRAKMIDVTSTWCDDSSASSELPQIVQIAKQLNMTWDCMTTWSTHAALL